MKLYEATYDGGVLKEIGSTMVSFPSLKWNITNPIVFQKNITKNGTVECFQETQFNIFEMSDLDKKKINWEGLEFVIHLSNNMNSNRVKFDWILSKYKWKSPPNNTTYLVLDTNFISNNSTQNSSMVMNNGTVQMGNAFFNSSDIAYFSSPSLNGTVNVNISLDQHGSNGISMIYSTFPDDAILIHDPEFGFATQGGSNNNTGNNDDIWIWIGIGIGVAFVALILAVGVFLYIRKRKRTYETII
jgi:hypothetical protein